MKRFTLLIALLMGVTLAFLPACCVRAAAPTQAIEQTYELSDNEWVRQINAVAGPFTNMVGSEPGTAAENVLREYIGLKWPAIVVQDVTIVTTPQAPLVVANALDELLSDYPKSLIERQGMTVLVLVQDTSNERRAWLVFLYDIPEVMGQEEAGTALHIVEMLHVPFDERV